MGLISVMIVTLCAVDILARHHHHHHHHREGSKFRSAGREVKDVNVKFYLYTKKSPDTPYELKIGDVEALDKLKNRPTRIVVHGWLAKWDHSGGMSQTIKNALLDYDDVNVILVDWDPYSSTVIIWNAIDAIADVGPYVGQFVEFLTSHHVKPSTIHMIGHSLGGYVIASAAKELKKSSIKISRITGLDVAYLGLIPHHFIEPPKLEPGDAEFVDAMHTHTGGPIPSGIDYKTGDADFYPNGGSRQPGCGWPEGSEITSSDDPDGKIACSHKRAWEYFAESINNKEKHHFYSRKCEKIEKGKETGCGDLQKSQQMGYYANPKLSGYFYMETNKEYPYSKD